MYTSPIVTSYFVHVTLSPFKGHSYVYKSPWPSVYIRSHFQVYHLDKVYQRALAAHQRYMSLMMDVATRKGGQSVCHPLRDM